jgi:protein phosphatase 2C family protein 2/3
MSLSPDNAYILGIWDCKTSQEVVEFIRRGIVEKQDLVKICENLMDFCMAPIGDTGMVGCDNMTVIIVALLNGKTPEEWYQSIAKKVADGIGPVAPADQGGCLNLNV